MKVAFIYDGAYPYAIGGVEKRIWELAKRLALRGHEVTMFGVKSWEGEDRIYKEGVRLWGVCQPQNLFINGRRSIKGALYIAYKLLPCLLKERFDIIDCQNFPYFPCFSAKLASIVRKSCLVITWHEVWDNYWFKYLGKKGICGKIIERMATHLANNRMIAVSELSRGDLRRIGVRHDIRVIPNGVDINRINEIAPSNRGADIIFAGRLIKEKNIALLIKAIAYIQREIPNISCFIIGDGPERSNLERLIHKLNLGNNILLNGFLPEHNEVLSYMKSSRVFVSVSTREGFGISALEANACGLPVVTVSHPQNAICSLVTSNENGFICQLTEEAIAEKVLVALNRAEAMRERCIQYSRQYDWDEITNLIENYYLEKLSQS